MSGEWRQATGNRVESSAWRSCSEGQWTLSYPVSCETDLVSPVRFRLVSRETGLGFQNRSVYQNSLVGVA